MVAQVLHDSFSRVVYFEQCYTRPWELLLVMIEMKREVVNAVIAELSMGFAEHYTINWIYSLHVFRL